MPLVFAENEETESGVVYKDQTGISYQFPKIYRATIQPGERFIYYRGRRKRGGGRMPQVYFGVGVVGDIKPDPDHSGRFTCSVFDYLSFSKPVPFKDENGNYLESRAGRGYFQRGVRRISEEDFQRILQIAEISDEERQKDAIDLSRTDPVGYALPEKIKEVDAFAMNAAVEELRRAYPGRNVVVQLHNNPGFDVLVGAADEPIYVEVKGTQRESPKFFLSSGELHFSQRHADCFLLLVVYAIDFIENVYKTFWHSGAISGKNFRLSATQWVCELYNKRET